MAGKKNNKSAAAGGISKMEAVRRAMNELGFDATRTDIQKFVKERFDADLSLDVISTYKADIARKAAKPASKPGPKTAPAPTRQSNSEPGGIDLADIQAVKALVARVGAANLKALIDVLAR
jgi:hypothetical protein